MTTFCSGKDPDAGEGGILVGAAATNGSFGFLIAQDTLAVQRGESPLHARVDAPCRAHHGKGAALERGPCPRSRGLVAPSALHLVKRRFAYALLVAPELNADSAVIGENVNGEAPRG
jgi:hypothetical protein